MRRLLLAAATTAVFASVPAAPALADSREELREDLQHVRAVCLDHGYRSDDCRTAVRRFIEEHRDLLREIAREHRYGDHDYGDHRCGDHDYGDRGYH